MDIKYFLFTWQIVEIFIGYDLVFPTIIYLIYLIIPKPSYKNKSDEIGYYAIIITAFQQTNSLVPAVSSLLNLKFTNFLIYIVADDCDISNLQFQDNRIFLFKPEVTLSSNTKSHFYAINRFKRCHNRITIIDSDNLVERRLS
jgi:hypothetical protein